jgi:SAM-dependent methyltransferase
MLTPIEPAKGSVDRGPGGFYASYARFKDYRRPDLQPKHIRRFDRAYWRNATLEPGQAVLEIGCGTGQFLAYLAAKGITELVGIDQDSALGAYLPEAVAPNFRAVDVFEFLAGGAEGKRFDRVFLIDVLEHFTPDDGHRLLGALSAVLNPGARVVVRLPNTGSPWGGAYQWGDLTHRAAYNPISLRQLALAADYGVVAVHPVLEGSPFRQAADRMLQGLLGRILMTPPEIWTANFVAVLEKREGPPVGAL